MSTFHKNAYISWLSSTILLLKRNQLIYSLISHNVHLGIKPPQKHHHLFFPSPLLNLQTFKVSFFKYTPPSLYIVFLWTNPKNQVFQWTPICDFFDHVKPPHSPFSWKCDRRFNPTAEMERFALCFPDIQYSFGASKISDFWASTVSY